MEGAIDILEDAFDVCHPTLPPITRPIDALLCAYRLADGAFKEPLLAYFKAQAAAPRAFGSLFARALPAHPPPPPPPEDKPLVVLRIDLEDRDDMERMVREVE